MTTICVCGDKIAEKLPDLEEEIIEQRIKVIIVGDPGSGKSDVAKGADICVPFRSLGVSIGKKINLDKRINYQLTLIFWTLTKGRPRLTTYFQGAGAAIIVGDAASDHSIKKMRFWADSVYDNIGKIPIFFIGTRNDHKSSRTSKKIAELADDFNSRYFIMNREQENGLKTIFKSIAKHLARSYSKMLCDNPNAPLVTNTK